MTIERDVLDRLARAGPMTDLARARFLLVRLYPDLSTTTLEALMSRLEAEWSAATWKGFARPAILGALASQSG